MNSVKIWLIVAVVLIAVGILLVAVTIGGKRIEYETVTHDVSGSFERISVEAETADVAFLPSEDGRCRVVFYEHPESRHFAEVRDGTLTVGKADGRKWYNVLFSFGSRQTVTVYLPKASYQGLFVSESTGNVTIPADFCFGDIDIDVSTGDVTLCAGATGTVKVEATTGDIVLSDVCAESMTLSVSTGRITVEKAACAGDVLVNATTGNIVLTDVTCRSLTSEGSTGDLTMTDVVAAEHFLIERNTGDVHFAECDAADISVETTTGDVRGTLLSDKYFTAKSTTGNIGVPEPNGTGKCSLTTTTGDIQITVKSK